MDVKIIISSQKGAFALRSHLISLITPLILQLVIFEFENFRGKKVELSGECKDAFEKTQRVGSVIVESGP